MVTFERKIGEAIAIGDPPAPGEPDRRTWIVLKRTGHGTAVVGIRAPKDVRIERGERVLTEANHVRCCRCEALILLTGPDARVPSDWTKTRAGWVCVRCLVR